MKRRGVWIGLTIAAVVIAIGGGYWWTHRSHTTARPAAAAKVPVVPAETNPLFISDIKKHPVVASQLIVDQNVGTLGGGRSQIVRFTSDGLTEYALQVTPAGAAPSGGWPVIILCHGYIAPDQYRTDGSDYQSWVAELVRSGYVVIKPDYRGHGRSQGTAAGGHFAPDYTYDVMNLIASVKQARGVDGGRIALIGHSMGAHVALRTAVISPDVKASVYVSGVVGSMYDIFYNWPHPPYPNDQPVQVVRSNLQDLITEKGNPKTNPKFWDQASAINYVKDIKGPVQINAGTADDTVPIAFSQHLDTALKAANKTDELYLYEGGDHQFSRVADRALMLQRVEAFLATNLK